VLIDKGQAFPYHSGDALSLFTRALAHRATTTQGDIRQVTCASGANAAPTLNQQARMAVNRFRIAARSFFAVLACTLLALTLATSPLVWAVAGLSGAILAVATILQPALGLVTLALAIPFGHMWSLPFRNVGVVDGLVALTLAAWLARGLAAHRVVVSRTPLLWPLGVFLWLGALSLIPATSWQQGFLEWLKWAEFAALYLVATQVLNRRYVGWVLVALFSVAVLEVVLGAFQFTRHVGPEAFDISGRFTRAFGTLQQPNPYAGYLGYLMPVALSLAIGALASWWTTGKVKSLLVGLLCASMTLVLLVGIGLSWSRGAWLGAATAITVVAAFRSHRAMLIIGSIALAALILVLLVGPARLPGTISGRITALSSYVVGPDPASTEITDQNFSVLERLAHWQAGIRMFNSAPWLGVGIGNYEVAYPRFMLPHWYEPLGHAHNVYINFLAETGVFGAVAFLVLWVGAASVTYRTSQKSDPLLKSLALGLLGTIAYLTVHNLFDNLFVQHLQLELALLLGALVALRTQSPRPA
jgi:putative inorganic carbon (hco3(-)) transporter